MDQNGIKTFKDGILKNGIKWDKVMEPFVQIRRLDVASFLEDLDIGEHGFDGLLDDGHIGVDGVAVMLDVARMQPIHPLGLLVDAHLDVVQTRIRMFGLAVHFLGDALQPLQSLDFLVDGLVAFLVQCQQVVPVTFQYVRS